MGYLFNYLQKNGKIPIIRNRHDGRKVSYRELVRIARDLKLKGYSRLPKMDLVKLLEKYFAANKIILYHKSIKRIKRPKENIKKIEENTDLIVNNIDDEGNFIDPITLLSPIEEPYLDFETKNGKIVRYCLESLVMYISVSKIFKDPLTGAEYTDELLEEIQSLAEKYGIECKNFLELKNSSETTEQRERENLIAALRRESGSWIDLMSNIIQAVPPFEIPHRGAVFFNNQIIPPFLHMFRQLIQVDPEEANIILTQWGEFLKGPPNRPVHNPYNYLSQVLSWFEIVRQEEVLPHLNHQ